MTRKRLLERYTAAEDGRIAIDVAVPGVEDLYNDFERAMPFPKKDLNDAFADYLVDSAREIGGTDFMIRIDFDRLPDERLMDRIRRSTRNFFVYLEDRERRNLKKMFEASFLLGGVGFVLLGADIWLNRLFAERTGVIGSIMLEGLTIAAWVALWEAVANLLVQWTPHHRDILVYRRLAGADIVFRRTFSKSGNR
jgi:hypothetical protein